MFRMFDKTAEKKTNFIRECLKNSLVESVVGEHTELSPKEFLSSFTRVHFLPIMTYYLADCMCRFRTQSRMFAFGWLAVAWEWLETTLGVLGLSFDGVI